MIKDHNKNVEMHGYTLKMNKFGDLTNEEFAATYLKPIGEDDVVTFSEKSNVSREMAEDFFGDSKTEKAIKNLQIPSNVDWKAKGAVTHIRDQGKCHGYWAFASIAAIEGSNFIRRKKNETLSEQQIIDCVNGGDFKSDGCNGGVLHEVFDYAKKSDLCAAEDYEWSGEQGT